MSTSSADIWKRRIDEWTSEYRQKESVHKQATNYYNNEFPPGLITVNLIFSFGRAMVPQLYFKNPSVNVQIKGDLSPASNYLQEIDEELIKQMRLKSTFKKMIVSAYLTGRGVGKLGYSADESPIFDPTALIKPRAPWFLHTLTQNWAHEIPKNGDVDGAKWAAMRTELSRDQIDKIDGAARRLGDKIDVLRDDEPDDTLEVWEIWDRGAGERWVLHDDVWVETGAPFSVWPWHILDFNQVPGKPLPVSDAELILKMQMEYNETNTQLAEHRRISTLKAIGKKGAIKGEERDKLERGNVGAYIEAETTGALSDSLTTFVPQIPEGLFAAKAALMQDARDVIGFSRNQLGEMQGSGSSRRTFGEAAIVQQALQIRLDERRDMGADVLEDVIRGTNMLIFEQWTSEDAARYAGLTPMGAESWGAISRLTKDDYVVKIVPDSTLPLTKAVQRQNSTQLYTLLKGDPLTDQLELRKMLFDSFEGIDPAKMINQQAAAQLALVPGAEQAQVLQGGAGQQGALGQPQPKAANAFPRRVR